MKNRFYHLSIASYFCLLLTMISCQKMGIDSQPDLPLKMETDVQPEYTVLAMLPRDIVFTVSANTPWKIESDQNWCIPTPGMSSASALIAEIMVKMEKNESEQPRTAILTIKAAGIDTPKTVTIMQDAKGKLEIQPIEESFSVGGATKEFTICTNKEWTARSSSTWLTFDTNNGPGDNKVMRIHATVAPNDGAKRKATVTVKSGLEERSFDVVQDGVELEFSDITTEATNFAGTGNTRVYKVKANTAWKAELTDKGNADWVTLTPAENELIVKVSYNRFFTKRQAQIRLVPQTPVQGMEEEILTIHQGINVKEEVEAGNSITYDEKGAAHIQITGGRARLVTNTPYQLGKFTWKFSSIDMVDDASWFDMTAWPDLGSSTANFHFWLWSGGSELATGAAFTKKFSYWSMTNEEIKQAKKVVLTINHDPVNTGKLKMTLEINDQEVGVLNNCVNPYTDPKEVGSPFFFGFNNCGSAASCVIESFEAIPYE